VADTDGVELSADGHVVPNSGPLADDHVTDKSCVRGDPSIGRLWNAVVERHSLAVTRSLLQVSDIACVLASHAIKFYANKLSEHKAGK